MICLGEYVIIVFKETDVGWVLYLKTLHGRVDALWWKDGAG